MNSETRPFWEYVKNGEWRKETKTVSGSVKILKDWDKNGIVDFKVDVADERTTNPGSPQDEIRDVNEKAYQRAFFNYTRKEKQYIEIINSNKKDKVGIKWLDYEIPPVFGGKGRRKCFDLIGEIVINDKPVNFIIAEIKVAKSRYNSLSPLYALFECLYYGMMSFNNKEMLVRQKVYHGKTNYWKEFKDFPCLVIAGNDDYWKYWKDKSSFGKEYWDNYISLLEKVNDKLPNKPKRLFPILLVGFKTINFECQKGNKKEYIPKLPNKEYSLWEVVDCKK